MAFKVLDSYGYHAVENDKDPGWTLAPTQELEMVEELLLRSMPYQAVGGLPPTLGEDHEYWIGRIAKLEGGLELKKV